MDAMDILTLFGFRSQRVSGRPRQQDPLYHFQPMRLIPQGCHILIESSESPLKWIYEEASGRYFISGNGSQVTRIITVN